jgi:DNA-binding response OmpR family regulator
MLVEADRAAGDGLILVLTNRGHKVIWAESAEEALRLLHDTIYIGSKFDALLANYHLNDSSALRVIRDFRNEFKEAPVGLMSNQDDIATVIWAKSKGIPILDKPVRESELMQWLSSVERGPASA